MESETGANENTNEETGSIRASTPTAAASASEEGHKISGQEGSNCDSLAGSGTKAGVAGDVLPSSSLGSDLKGKDKDKDKINILLKPVGDAPILKNKLWAVPAERLVSQITEFVKKYLKLEKQQNLFFFVNQLFAPAPDQCLRDLYECFGSDGKLVLHYSTTVAWG